MSNESLDKVLHHLDKNFEASCTRLFELLRFKSVSTDPAYKEECSRAAAWLTEDLRGIGFETVCHKTEGHPIIVGHHHKAGTQAPHVLFYGHYDVQPVDPLNLWEHDPFDPQLKERDGYKVIVARGASDDKGQFMTFVEAARAYKQETGNLPLNVTILLEGEEEAGSLSLEAFLKTHKEELKAPCALVSDTSMWNRNTPAISLSLRGALAEEVVIKAANRDLHSGHYGGVARNPIHVLTRILADMHDENGGVAIPHFYDGVAEPEPELLTGWNKLQFDAEGFLKPIGLKYSAGEKGRHAAEQLWSRPTAEINGIGGGYQGDGFKTVIPAEARAKVSFRLVKGQNPHKVAENFRAFVKARLPEDCRVEFANYGAAPALKLSPSSPWISHAQKALSAEWDTEAVLIGAGGSVPITNDFREVLGAEPLLVGFGLEDDCIHSPNEKYELQSFHKGQRSWARIMAELAKI